MTGVALSQISVRLPLAGTDLIGVLNRSADELSIVGACDSVRLKPGEGATFERTKKGSWQITPLN